MASFGRVNPFIIAVEKEIGNSNLVKQREVNEQNSRRNCYLY